MKRLMPLLFVSVLASCSTPKSADPVDPAKSARNVAIRLHAAPSLNSDGEGRPLALLARIYKLRNSAAFEQASYDTFLSPQKEREHFGSDLVEVKEIMLVPGQRYETIEKVSKDAYFVGVVGLFHAPAPKRWRLVMAAAQAEKTGMTIGATTG